VLDAEVAVGEIRRRAARLGFIGRRGQRFSDRRCDERLFRPEVSVKRAVGEVSLFHDLRHGDVAKAALPKQPRGCGQDLRFMMRDLLVCTENPNSDHSGDEVRPGWHVNE
jgi:hypothetical protein